MRQGLVRRAGGQGRGILISLWGKVDQQVWYFTYRGPIIWIWLQYCVVSVLRGGGNVYWYCIKVLGKVVYTEKGCVFYTVFKHNDIC